MSNNDKCLHNPTFYIIERKYVQVQCMFDIFFICYSVFNIFYADTLSRGVYTYQSVVMYDIILHDWYSICFFINNKILI